MRALSSSTTFEIGQYLDNDETTSDSFAQVNIIDDIRCPMPRRFEVVSLKTRLDETFEPVYSNLNEHVRPCALGYDDEFVLKFVADV